MSGCPGPEELAALADGLLSGDDLRRVAAHLDVCPSCLAALSDRRPADVLIAALRRGGEPDGQTAAVSGGRYVAVRLHATGGLGEVHEAEDTELGRRVALKRVRAARADDPDSRRRFLREAAITARLEHPGVVPVYGLGWDADGRPHYAMRLVEGESLHQAVRAFHDADRPGRDPGERRLAQRALLGRFAAVCQTVAYAHSRGMIHRDLKPANVMLGKFGETLVVDWGLAKRVGSAATDGDAPSPDPVDGETQTGERVGTPAYMSPEQAAGRWDVVGPASDVYGLGATLYTILTGRPPLDPATTPRAVAPPRQVKPEVPPALEAVCLKAMSARPEDRYASAAEVGAEVERWLAGEPVAAYPDGWPARAGRWARRHRVAVGGLAAGLLVAAVLGGGGGVWLARTAADRRAERARLEAKDRDAVDRALAEMPGLVGAWRFREAAGLLDQTAAGLSEFAPPADRDRLDQARTDVRLAERVDAIRVERSTLFEGKLNPAAASAAYAAAFERHGLDCTGAKIEELGRRIATSPVRDALLAALDDWAVQEEDSGRRDRLTRIARAADPHPAWRDPLRDALARRDWAALRRLAERADVDHLSPAVLVVLGQSLGLGTSDAARLLRRAQGRHPADFWLNFYLGAAVYRTSERNAAEAARYFQACLAARPDSGLVRLNLAVALGTCGNYDAAAGEYRRAIELDAKPGPARLGLAVALLHTGDRAGAEDALRRAGEIDPDDTWGQNNLGLARRMLGDLAGAEAAFRRVVALDPGAAVHHGNLGSVLFKKGDYAGAEASFRRAVAIDPGDDRLYAALGDALIQRGNYAGAETECRRAVGLNPNNALAHAGLGNALFKKGDYVGAEAAYRRAIVVDPSFAGAYSDFGTARGMQGDWAGAEAAFRRAIEIDRNFVRAHSNLGNALARKEDWAGAEAAFRRVTELEPGNVEAHGKLGIVLEQRRDWAGAEAAERRVVELRPGDVEARVNLARVLLLLGRFEEARATARRAVDLAPPGRPPHDRAADQLRRCDAVLRLDAKLTAVLRGEAQPAGPADYQELAEVALLRRRYAAAARLYKELFRQNPAAAADPSRRLYAVSCAARSGCGLGADDPAPDAAERARWRRQALNWLRDDLMGYAARLTAADPGPKEKEFARSVLRRWQTDPDLAGVRDEAGLAALPDDERAAWRQFWSDVAVTLAPRRK